MDHFDIDDSGADHHQVKGFCDPDYEWIHDTRFEMALAGALIAMAIVAGLLIAYYGG